METSAATAKSLFEKIGPFMPTVAILGVTLPALIYLLIMVSLGWSYPILGAKATTGVFNSANAPVYLYESPATKNHFTKIGGNYDTLLTPWKNYFSERSRAYKSITTEAALVKLKAGVLVLPSAVALSEVERNAILKFQENGGSILATWATGTRNDKGEWTGWQLLERFGATFVGEIPNDEETRQLILTGESPLSHTHPAGQRIWMGKTPELLLRIQGEMAAGRLMNWARIPDDSRRQEGAIVYSENPESGTRSAVFAFSENAWESRPFATQLLIDDTMRWLKHEAVAIRAAWPHGKRAANVIEMDTEDGFSNSLEFIDQMKKNGVPATCYVLTSVAKSFPQVTKDLAKGCEIALHGDVHDSFKAQASEVQRKRISDMKTEITTLLPNGNKLFGFRAPTEGYDKTTEKILQTSGFKHHSADPQRSEARLPLFAGIVDLEPATDLIVLPRTQRDDINLATQKLSAEQTSKALIDDFDEALRTSSLGWMSVHSQNFAANGVLATAFPEYLAHVRKNHNQVWLTTANQVADWWRNRERFKLDTAYNGRRFDMNITIKGQERLAGSSVVVMLPRKGFVPHVSGTKIGMPLPTVNAIDDFRASLVFPALDPGNYSYQVTFAPR
jgi:peptidoglycan/xylan/chitin deacetylase (PgdA/CDA1 family)